MIRIYVECSVLLTLVTFLFYYWLLQHDGLLFRPLAPKVRIATDWRMLTSRPTARNRNPGVELRTLSA